MDKAGNDVGTVMKYRRHKTIDSFQPYSRNWKRADTC